MTGAPANPIVPPRGQTPAVRDGLPQVAPAGSPPGVGLRVFCGVVAAFAAVMFAALVVLGLKEADRAIRRADRPQPALSAEGAEKAPS